jgi:hypothetical protein
VMPTPVSWRRRLISSIDTSLIIQLLSLGLGLRI